MGNGKKHGKMSDEQTAQRILKCGCLLQIYNFISFHFMSFNFL